MDWWMKVEGHIVMATLYLELKLVISGQPVEQLHYYSTCTMSPSVPEQQKRHILFLSPSPTQVLWGRKNSNTQCFCRRFLLPWESPYSKCGKEAGAFVKEKRSISCVFIIEILGPVMCISEASTALKAIVATFGALSTAAPSGSCGRFPYLTFTCRQSAV